MNSFDLIFGNSARRFPSKTALCDECLSLTYSQLNERVDNLAGSLGKHGVCPGDVVMVIACNSCASIEVLLACLRMGAVYSSCNTRFSAEIIAGLLCDAAPKAVVASRSLFAQLQSQEPFCDKGLPFACVSLDGASGGACLSYNDLTFCTSESSDIFSCEDDYPAMVLYTSGTTMKPKDVVLSHGALARRVEIDTRSMGITREDAFLCVLPLFHITCITPLVMLANGACVVIRSRHDPHTLSETIKRYSISFVGLIPVLLKRFVDYLEENPQDFPSLRTVFYGGSPMTPEFAQRAQLALPCGFLQGYGMTETSSSVTLLSSEDHKDPRLLNTVGKAVEGMEIRIVDDDLNECPVGVAGEIAVKTLAVMSGYGHHPDKTAQVLRKGWYLTGDIGFVDEFGYLTLLDRKDNMIITGGENVFPLQVANCIRAMDPRIVDACAVGLPDAKWGEIVAAVVVVEDGFELSEDAVKQYCKERLGGFMKPQKVVVTSDSLERNAVGKIDRGYVRALLAEE